MKLELKHIVGYLPYELQIKCGNITRATLTLDTVTSDLISVKEILLNQSLKPILRQMSDLTKEIEVNGEKFVPMHKLLEYSETNYFSEDDNIKIKFNTQILSCDWNIYKYSKEQDAIIKYVERTSDGDLIYSLTYSSLLRRFVFRDETHKRPLGVGYQIDLFQKLYEWHFDIHDLIGKGLVIDINTLTK